MKVTHSLAWLSVDRSWGAERVVWGAGGALLLSARCVCVGGCGVDLGLPLVRRWRGASEGDGVRERECVWG